MCFYLPYNQPYNNKMLSFEMIAFFFDSILFQPKKHKIQETNKLTNFEHFFEFFNNGFKQKK